MKIAIFGSYKEGKGQYVLNGDKTSFQNACYQLGSRIVKDGHQIITGSPSNNTADFHVVRGAVDYLKDKNINYPFIEIVRPIEHSTPFLEYYEDYPGIFKYHISDQHNWQGSHLISIRESDCIFTIGGGRSTYAAGLAAIISGRKVYPVGSFGGASRLLIKDIKEFSSDYHKDLALLNNPWSSNTIDKLIEISEINNSPKILIIHGRSNDNNILKDYLISEFKIPENNIIIMTQANRFGKTLPEKFESLANTVHCAIALATQDDYGYYKLLENEKRMRARQNVWLEVGWFWGKLGRNKVMILCQNDIEIPSDLLGIEFYKYQESPEEKADELKDFLKMVSRK